DLAGPPGRVMSVRIVPEEPAASKPALEAIKLADWVILGPGSWFTSVMPHLLVPELQEALVHTAARRILTLNVGLDDDETFGFSPAEHVEVLSAHAPDLTVDYVIVDPVVVRSEERALREVAHWIGAELVVTPVRKMRRPREHDTLRLAAAYRDVIFGGCAGSTDTSDLLGGHHGHDGPREGRTQPAPRHQDLLQEGRGLHDAPVRRRPAHHRRPDRDRGGGRHRTGGSSAEGLHGRGLRLEQ